MYIYALSHLIIILCNISCLFSIVFGNNYKNACSTKIIILARDPNCYQCAEEANIVNVEY